MTKTQSDIADVPLLSCAALLECSMQMPGWMCFCDQAAPSASHADIDANSTAGNGYWLCPCQVLGIG